MRNLKEAIAKADAEFETLTAAQAAGTASDIRSQGGTDKKSRLISYATVMIQTLTEFFRNFSGTTAKLATIRDILTTKLEVNQPIQELISQDQINNLSALVQKQFEKPGLWQTLKAVFKQQVTPAAAIAHYGLDYVALTQDLLSLTPKQLSGVIKDGQIMPVVAMHTQAPSAQAAQTVATTTAPEEPAATAAPAQPTQATGLQPKDVQAKITAAINNITTAGLAKLIKDQIPAETISRLILQKAGLEAVNAPGGQAEE